MAEDPGPAPVTGKIGAADTPRGSIPIVGFGDGASARLGPLRRAWLALEFCVLYLGIPGLAAAFVFQFRGFLLPSLVVGAVALTLLLRNDPSFDRRRLVNLRAFRTWWWRILLLVAAFAALVAVGIAIWDPDQFLALPRQRPYLWLAIMFGYPLLSVYPQEIIFRTWLFHRYQPLFRSRWLLIAASTLAFGFAHIMFQNAIALILTTIGGFVFARTYDRSRSTFVVAVEHALYGAVIFTLGLGSYFYLGAVGRHG